MAEYPEEMHQVRGKLATAQSLFGGLPEKIKKQAADIEAKVTTGAISLEGARAFAEDFSKKMNELHEMSVDEYAKTFGTGKAHPEKAVADASAEAHKDAAELNAKKAQDGTGVPKDSNIGLASRNNDTKPSK
jgi:hypothetical protein